MKEKIRKIIDSRQFHISILIFIITIIVFTVGMIALKYNVEGENNLPFELTRISVISTIEGTDNNDLENKWNLTVDQNNDIYLYIKKNDNYKSTEVIQNITIDNLITIQKPNIGETKIFKPDSDVNNSIFKNVDTNIVEKIEYTGELESSIKDSKISNQGGLIVFRYANTKVGNYISNDDVEINHNELLKKLNIENEDLIGKISFDITIKLESGKSYKANVELDIPIGNVVENGTQSKEYTNLENIIFKRVNND